MVKLSWIALASCSSSSSWALARRLTSSCWILARRSSSSCSLARRSSSRWILARHSSTTSSMVRAVVVQADWMKSRRTLVMVARRRRCSSSSGSARLIDSAVTVMVGRRRRSRSGAGNLLDGAGDATTVRCRQRNNGLARRSCARWWEVCVEGVRDGGRCAGLSEVRWTWRRRRITEVRRCCSEEIRFF